MRLKASVVRSIFSKAMVAMRAASSNMKPCTWRWLGVACRLVCIRRALLCAPANKAVLRVKGGQNVQRNMIADLKNTVAREKAEIGIFITLVPPTREMMKEAAAAGLYDSPLGGGRQVPRIQILTIEGLLNGRERAEILDMGFGALNFKQAKKEAPKEKQGKLLLG